MTETLLQRTLRHEGFEPKPYEDSVGVLTIGHGLTYLTEEESEAIVENRLIDLENVLLGSFFWIRDRPVVLDVMTEMCFQLGVTGCRNFKKMWAALEAEDYKQAYHEMIDSKWYKQTPKRCHELATIIRGLV